MTGEPERKKRKTARINGTEISYLERGEGAAFVMIHGLMANALDFQFQFDRFGGRFRCLAPDLRGFGGSQSAPPDSVRLEQAVEDMLEFIESAAPPGERITLLGHSFGAVIALELLSRNPGRLRRLVLCGAPAGVAESPLAKLGISLYPLAAPFVNNRFLIDFYSLNINISPANATPELREAIRRRNGYIGGGAAASMGGYLRSMLRWRIPGLTGAAGVPVLIARGARDPLARRSAAARLKLAIPHAHVRTIRNAGHSPMYEAHARFNNLLEQFFETT